MEDKHFLSFCIFKTCLFHLIKWNVVGIHWCRLECVLFPCAKYSFCSPGVDSMGVMHEVRGHLKGKADWIACGNRVLHPRLIVLQQRDTFTHTFMQPSEEKCCVHLPTLCSPPPSRKQLPALVCTCTCFPKWTERGNNLCLAQPL